MRFTLKTTQQKFLTLIKSNKLAEAKTLFDEEIEIADALKQIKALNKKGDVLVASIYQNMVDVYEAGDEVEVEVEVEAPAPKVERDSSTVYPDHGGDEIFHTYRLKKRVEGEHALFSGVPRFSKGHAGKVVKALAIRDMWFQSIAKAQKDGAMKSKLLPNAYYTHAYWLTRYARQQIKSCFTDLDLKEYYTDDMPMPSDADEYKPTRKTAPKK